MKIMDYHIIISNAFSNINRNDLKYYFEREFKKAERDSFYNLESFFKPIYEILNKYELSNKKAFDKKIKSIKNGIEMARNNKLSFYDDYLQKCLDKQGIDYDEYKMECNKKYLQKAEEELNKTSISSIVGDRICGLNNNQVQQIRKAINLIVGKHDTENDKDINSDNAIINKHIAFMSSTNKRNGKQIMSGSDYTKMLSHLDTFLQSPNKLPSAKLNKPALNQAEIFYSFYKLYNELDLSEKGIKKQDLSYFIACSFKGMPDKDSIAKKLSTPPSTFENVKK